MMDHPIGTKVYVCALKNGIKKGVIVGIRNDIVTVKITSRGPNAWPWQHGMYVKFQQHSIAYR